MNRRIRGINSLLAVTLSLFLFGCPRHGDDSRLFVKAKDFTTLEGTQQQPGTRQIQAMISFNKGVDQTTVVPGQSLILTGEKDNNAAGQLTWSKDTFPNDKLIFTTNKPWGQIGATFTLTLKSTIRAKDNSPLEQCKTGKPGTEQPGDCVLFFVIPG